jgi:hypothetical protein
MRRTLIALSALLVVPAVASAQSDPNTPSAQATASPPTSGDPLAKENWPLSGVDRPLALSGGMLQLDVNGSMSLTKELVGKPINMPLALWYGITNELQAGIVHSRGLCLSGKDNNCAKVYDDIALQLLLSLFGRGSALEIASWAQLNVATFDPATLSLQVGGAMNWVTGGSNVAILAYPNVGIGLNEREPEGGTLNKETIGMPVAAYFRAGERVAPVLFTGLGQTALDGFGDFYTVPVGVGVLVALSNKLDIGARFDMPRLIAKHAEGEGAADSRAATIWVSLRPL